MAFVCSILASVIAVPGIKLISSFKSRRSDRFMPSTLYSSNRGCSCTLIRRDTPVNVFSVMNILTSENKPTLYNLFIASGISSPGNVILVPAMSEAALIMNCVLVFSFPSTLTLSMIYILMEIQV